MVALDVEARAGAEAVRAVRTLHLGGLMVTMPHKSDVIAALDGLTPAAQALGAVNSIAWEGDQLVGDNTDGAGLVDSLSADQGFDPRGHRCVVVGAGGAARSIVWALADAGASEVVVLNRTAERAEIAAALAGDRGRVGSVESVGDADLVVNATSVGMGADPGSDTPVPFDTSVLRAGQIVVDAVYQPLETPLLRAAAEMGAIPVDGVGMLVHQAARTIRRWIGTEPDIAAMNEAARTTL